MSRHEKRQRLRELRRVVKAVEKGGIGARPEMVELAALVSLLDAALSSNPAAGRSARVMAVLGRALDRAVAAAPGHERIACRAGCHWCCDLYVSAPAPQVFAIADHIRAAAANPDATLAKLRGAVSALQDRGGEATAANRFCAFLEDGRCSIYAARPAACRTHGSFSAAQCEAAFRRETDEVAVPDYIPSLRGGVEQALAAVLDRWRLSAENYELAPAVLVALEAPDAEARWYDGEDIFAGVGTDDADSGLSADSRRLQQDYREALWAAAHGAAVVGPFADRFPAWCR